MKKKIIDKILRYKYLLGMFLSVTLILLIDTSLTKAQSSIIEDSLKSITNEKILESYQILLAQESELEYGWVCQSIIPMIPKGREAILTLIRAEKFPLIKTLLSAPKLETQLYALDALIYEKIKLNKHIGSELNSKVEIFKLNYTSVTTCSDFNENNLDRIFDVRTIIFSLTNEERFKKTDLLLNGPFK